MSDITVCTASDCSQHSKCGRHKWNAKINPFYQSYSDFSQMCRDDNQYIMLMEKEKRSGDSIDYISR